MRRFGVLAEDETDAKALRVIIQRQLGAGVAVKAHAGNGCAHLRRKAAAWMEQFALAGYRDVILLHDLDRNSRTNALHSEPDLRRQLETISVPKSIKRHICIPIEEMEAWFWADPKVLKHVGRGQGAASASPHNIAKPKEALIKLSRDANSRPRYSTEDNAQLASVLDFELCARRCSSFSALLDFLGSE